MVGRLVAWSDVCFRTAKATGFEGTDEELGELFVAIAGSGAKTLSLPNIEEWYKAETVRARKASADSQHVMISYSWANQEAVIAIKKWLESEGYNVWLDIEMMCGSTLETMAKAVEDAECFVMAVSDAYKNSPNCRGECILMCAVAITRAKTTEQA